LQQVKKLTKCNDASYVSVSKKFRFEIELPESVKVAEDDFVCTSKVKGKRRYQTEKLQDLI
jgi:MutS family domain IV